MKMLFAAALVVAAPSAQAANPYHVDIGRFGEVTATETGPPTDPRPGNVVGSTPVTDPRFVTLGADIEGLYCKQFGFEFRAPDLPPLTAVPVEIRLDHPLWTLPDGRTSTRETNENVMSSHSWSYSGYTLEEPFSLVPGTWTFSVMMGDTVLATVSFNVTVPPDQHPSKDGCTAATS